MNVLMVGDALLTDLRTRYAHCYGQWEQKYARTRRRKTEFDLQGLRFFLLQGNNDPCQNNMLTMYYCIVRLLDETDKLRTGTTHVAQKTMLEHFETYKHIFDRNEKEFNQQFAVASPSKSRARATGKSS